MNQGQVDQEHDVDSRRALPRWFALSFCVASIAGMGGAWLWARGSFWDGAALTALSLLLLRWPRSLWLPLDRLDLSRPLQRWGLLIVCATALFFRCYRMEPPGLWGDDAINGLLAFDVLDGKISSPLQLVDHSFSTFHAFSNYLIAGAFLLFGAEPLSIRIPGIVANLLAVPMMYGIVAPLFGPRAGLLAALLFASSPFELGHAKGLLQDILGQSLAIAGLFLIVQGALRDRRWMLVAAGVPIALALYTYHAAKLVPVIAAFGLWQVWRIARRRDVVLGRSVLMGAALFAVCALPAVIGYVKNPEALTQRISGTGLWATISTKQSLWPLWDSLWRTFGVFHYQQGPIYHWFGIGTDPGVNIAVGFLILHGLALSLRHWRTPPHAFLLGWFLIGVIPGLFSTEAPRGYRILNGAPVVFVWAALPLARVLSLRVLNVTRVAALALLVTIPLIDFNYYFYRVYSSGVFRWFQADAMVEMARTLRARGVGWTGYLIADNFTRDYESLRFLSRAWNLQLRDVASLGDALPVRVAGDALFMIMRTPYDSVALLRSMYPGIEPDERFEPVPRYSWFDPLFWKEPPSTTPRTVTFFPVTAETAASAHGLTATFAAPGGATVATRVDALPMLRGPQDLPTVPAGTSPPNLVVWSGSLFVPSEGTYAFRVEANQDVLVSIGSGVTVTRDSPRASRPLAQGLNPITVAVNLGDSTNLQLFWQPPGQAETRIPAGAFFRFPANGLLAEYQLAEGTRRRIEPFPYFMFWAHPFPGRYSATWSGKLTVPSPGQRKLSVESDRAAVLEVDGKVLTGEERLSAGKHTLKVTINGIEEAPRLRLYWALPDREREIIPPVAYGAE